MNALVIVDLQNDFCEGGALEVNGASYIVPIINAQIPKFDLVVATQDWHPANHKAFASNNPGKKIYDSVDGNILWPDHCVQYTEGASFHHALKTDKICRIFPKGTDPEIHNYSAFFNCSAPYDRMQEMPLAHFLRQKKVSEITVVGLALDYCVKYTALDAIALGFEVSLIVDATRAVNLQRDHGDLAIEEMKENGVIINV